jgi:catecholate siderophore receptor
VPEWNIWLAYTYLDTEIIKGLEAGTQGKRLANAPTNTFSLWTTYDVLTRWQVGTGIPYSVPGYVRWDLTAAYQINKNMGVRLNVQHVMDTTYYDQVHPAQAIPGDGRTFIVSGNFTF